MFWFVQIGLLLLTTFAARAITSWIQARQKPPGLPEFQAPIVATGTPITVHYGTCRFQGVTAWFGGAELVEVNLSTIDNVFRIGRTRTLAYQYKVTLMQVLCWGQVTEIKNMIFGNRPLSDQALSQQFDLGDGVVVPVPTFGGVNIFDVPPGSVGSIEIYHGGVAAATLFLPNIFGGRGRGGGFTAGGGDANNPYGGFLRFYIGNRNTDPDPVMEAALGVGNVPNYNDLCYMVWDGVNVGESSQVPAIDYILFRGAQFTFAGVGANVGTRSIAGAKSDWQMVDYSPVAILYDMLVNPIYGLGFSPDMIDTASLQDAHTQLVLVEGLGMSMKFAGDRSSVEEAIREIERTVDGVLNRDPFTFKWTFKLIRDEAPDAPSFAALRSFDESSITGLKLNRSEWIDTFNVLTVEFTDAERLLEKNTVTLRNDANIAMTGGERAMPNVQYLGITDRATALKLNARDLRKTSVPLWKGQMKTTRAGWDLERGDVFKLTYAKYEISELVMRVLAIDYGTEDDNEMTIDIVEDVFHYDTIATPSAVPSPPVLTSSAIRPTVISVSQTKSGAVGTLTFTPLDPEHRITEVAVNTMAGGGSPSGWVVLATGTPMDDLSHPFSATVALNSLGDSSIAYRITYDWFGQSLTLEDEFVFPMGAASGSTQVTGSPSGGVITWDVTGKTDETLSVILSANASLVITGQTNGFRGRVLVTSTGAGGYSLTLPPGSLYGTGASSVVTLGLKDELEVYYDGTYFWWSLLVHITTLPPIPLNATLDARVTMDATLNGSGSTMHVEGSATGDLSI